MKFKYASPLARSCFYTAVVAVPFEAVDCGQVSCYPRSDQVPRYPRVCTSGLLQVLGSVFFVYVCVYMCVCLCHDGRKHKHASWRKPNPTQQRLGFGFGFGSEEVRPRHGLESTCLLCSEGGWSRLFDTTRLVLFAPTAVTAWIGYVLFVWAKFNWCCPT